MIEIKKNIWGLIKANAKASRNLVDKKTKNLEKIESLIAENKDLTTQIEALQSSIINITGHTTEDLVKRVVTVTGKVDKDGKVLKSYDYVPKENAVRYNEEKKVYEIFLDDEPIVETENTDDEEAVEATVAEQADTQIKAENNVNSVWE